MKSGSANDNGNRNKCNDDINKTVEIRVIDVRSVCYFISRTQYIENKHKSFLVIFLCVFLRVC